MHFICSTFVFQNECIMYFIIRYVVFTLIMCFDIPLSLDGHSFPVKLNSDPYV